MEFSHLHVHTQFSLLDGAADIKKLFAKAAANQMRAMAITDHGNMFGVFKFVAEAANHGVKPIVGCEFYVVEDRHKKQFTKELKDKRYHQLMLAKNSEGYQNLIKLCSLGYLEGLYSKWPRIDKELILKYHKGLIATTCCLGAEVPRTILQQGEEAGEKVFKWWLDLFGEDYYIELQRHNLPEQEIVNAVLLKFSKKYGVKIIASNDSHYVDEQDSNAHDILLCVNTGDKQSTPIATDEEGGRGYRFGFPNNEFFFKTKEEMLHRFSDLPEALDQTGEIVDKIETLNLKRDILVPHFPLPEGFSDADDYLRHLTMMGAKKRYGEISPEVEERLNFELHTIKTMGFPGYFLIVADFIREGRNMGVVIGPGRGSAAGSAVAYCIGITNIDPIKYNLLFERFLNPERKSMPDIDTDFDDAGREKVMNYVIEKYGKNQVAQIINYGTMAARSAIKDVARVLDLPLNDSNELAKLVPEKPGTKLLDAIDSVPELKQIASGTDLKSKVIAEALKLEGSVRNTGIHASAVIIAPENLLGLLPLSLAKDSNLWVTQWDGSVIESAGLLKMDFLGLKTLSIINGAVSLIKENHQVDIHIDQIPLDDQKTLQLFQKGETVSIFQFESEGMQKSLRELKPDKFEDLIAMNALYRPGPIENIPTFISRKHGREPIVYDFEITEDLLRETYGVTVYQEQVMLLSQRLAGFSKGDADNLRKAMGKKQKETLDKMKDKFLKGCEANGNDVQIAEKVWKAWEAFASYAFNKSHATCYSYVAFQTAYIKAHYPAEYMAAVLNAQINVEQTAFFMEECKRMGITVLGPDINESAESFTVNSKGDIRFGLTALKGVGQAAIENIVAERKLNGPYKSVFDLARRINLRASNKKVFEGLAYGGAFDSFENHHRAQFFHTEENDGVTFLEKIIRYGQHFQDSKNSSQVSLFGEETEVNLPEPMMPDCAPWSNLEKLKKEKEVIGMFISGHPLDDYRFEMKYMCRHPLSSLHHPQKFRNTEIAVGAIITSANHQISKKGNPWCVLSLEDQDTQFDVQLYGDDYLKWKMFLQTGLFVYLNLRTEEWKAQNRLVWKVTNMMLLSDLRDKLTRKLDLILELDQLNEELLNTLVEKLKENPGKWKFKIKVNHTDENMLVELDSVNTGVNMSDAMVRFLMNNNVIGFSLN